MENLFNSNPISYFSRLYKGFIRPFIIVWLIWLIIYFIIIPDYNIYFTLSVLSIMTVLFAVFTIQKLRFLLLSIDYVNDNFSINYMDYNKLKHILISRDLNIELKFAWERGVTVKLLFFEKDKLLFKIFAKKQNEKHNNESFQALYKSLIDIKNNKKGSA
jgi:hypothetical protein